MNVLITGGAGYIGCSLIEQLINLPEIQQIKIYDNLSKDNYQLFTHPTFQQQDIQFIQANILDNHSLQQALQGIDIVYHLAAKVVNPDSDADSSYFEQVNNWGTANLVNEVSKTNVQKFVYLSTVYVYGQGPERKTTEDVPAPNSFYGISKLRGEEHVKTLSPSIETYIIRSGSVYGDNLCTRFEVLVNHLLFQSHYFNKITINGEGNQVRPFIHIDKLAESLSKISTTVLESGTYNLLEHNASVMDIVEELIKIYPELEYNHVNRHIRMKDVIVEPSLDFIQKLDWTVKEFYQEIKEFKSRLW